MRHLSLIALFTLQFAFSLALASGDHDETADEAEEHHEEASENVGPEKGITEKGKDGLKLSPEAIKSFGIKTIEIKSETTEIPTTAVVKVKDTKSIFRLRQGWFKRIEYQIVQKKSDSLVIRSSDLKNGDQVVISSEGFLRTAEVYSEEGATHSH